ncbi:MAG: phospholipase D family protein [Lentisphaerae bacterium]|nr:phospholipase D family protein [Lentisphaerota bacterium]
MLDADPSASRIVFVSAFVSVQTIMRMKQQVLQLKKRGVIVRFVLGIDLGGTSQEVLKEVLGWDIDIRIVKHRIPGHTFHPKLYLFEWADHATIIIGSNNITDGGFFGNYEGAARVTYTLPEEADAFGNACSQLGRFLQPEGPVAYQLTDRFLGELIARCDLPTEAESRKGRDVAAKAKKSTTEKGEPIFGIEDIAPPPPLPADLLDRLVKDVRARRTAAKKATKKKIAKKKAAAVLPIDDQVSDSLLPAAFYMTLPTLQGGNIPGEGRIPLEAIELAKEFWGWPDEYSKEVSPRAGHDRVYWNWRPKWRIWSVEAPGDVATQEVRMYMYENSSDFRFYVRPLVNAGGNLGDVVRIRRIAQPDAEFECVLARQGTPEYDEWINSCTQAVRNSTRSFGYA